MVKTTAATAAPGQGVHQRYPWLVPGVLLLVLALLIVNAVAHAPLTGLDDWIRHAVQAEAKRRSLRWVRHGPNTPARQLNHLGLIAVGGPVLAVAAVIAAVRRRSLWPLLSAAAGGAMMLLLTYLGKLLIREPAPRQVTLGPHDLGSFPSGHLATAGVCYFMAAVLLWPRRGSRSRRIALTVVTVVCAALGVSLIWCDLHWSSDVLAAAVLAALVVPLAARLDASEPRTRASARAQPDREPVTG